MQVKSRQHWSPRILIRPCQGKKEKEQREPLPQNGKEPSGQGNESPPGKNLR